MNNHLDPSLQRIIDGASGQGRHERPFNFQPAQSQNQNQRAEPEWSFGSAPRLEPMLFDEGGRDSYTFEPPLDLGRESYHYESSVQPPAQNKGPTRLSLAPRSLYNNHQQQEREPRTVTNADHHFIFAQNLRQGVPIGTSRQNIAQMDSPLSQLATNMLLQKPMPNRLHELQPPKQKITTPFNPSGFVYSPADSGTRAAFSNLTTSSSPSFNSSPTARVIERRVVKRIPAPIEYTQDEYGYNVDEFDELIFTAPETRQRQIAAPADNVFRNTPNRAVPPSGGSRKSLSTLSLAHAPPMAHGIQLISPHELPDRFRHVFPYELFSAAQSKCFAPIYKTTDNVVISAPTGSGKTVLLELAICKLVEGHGAGEFKIVYLAPTKSLCSERVRDWSRKFSHLNLPVSELTGDTNQSEMTKVRNASIIVTTPEKWDSITRKWSDYERLLQMVRLFLIDEVHMLKDTRGATLEAIVSRMRNTNGNVRFVALSATVPNSHDIAVWLGRNSTQNEIPALREIFGEDFRPVKLKKHVVGFDGGNNFAFDSILDGKIAGLIQKYTQKKPIMVFCFTRNSCEKTARILAEWWTKQKVVDRAWPAPTQKVVGANEDLMKLVGSGVAFHHAGLDSQDRKAVESAYLEGDIGLICCTTTLAVGVNLPCHLVVLKGTVGYQRGVLGEYSDLEVMQMLGRAGRPQFDDSAVAIIMTRRDKVEHYNKMVSGQDILESTLHLNLIEHLNSEISLGSIRSLSKAKSWLSGTFLSVRMRQNPDYYVLDGIVPSRDSDLRLQLVCDRDINLLKENRLITDHANFSCTEYGHAMSRYMVQFKTMKLLLSLPPMAKTEQILQLICQASEFKDLRMKPHERPFLREMNKSPFIKYPIKENVTTTAHKVSLIVQVQLGGVDLPTAKEFGARQYLTDKTIIFERIQRLIRCVVDCKSVDCDATATRYALDLARSLSAEFWENSNLQLQQIHNLGPVANRKLVAGNINSIEKLASLDTASIERIMVRNPPFGKKLLDSLIGFPRLTIIGEFLGNAHSKAGENPKVNVKSCLGFSNKEIPVWHGHKPSVAFMAETSDGILVHFWRGNIQKLVNGMEMKFTAELCCPGDTITCYVACDELIGTIRSCRLTSEVPASAFPPPKPKQATPIAPIDNNVVDEFGADEFEDDDFLAAANNAEAAPSENGSDEFADIDKLERSPSSAENNVKEKSVEVIESVQMENGRWTCNHPCRDGQPIKKGGQCKHKCCKEGLDKPRKIRKQKKSNYGTGELPATFQPKAKVTGYQVRKPNDGNSRLTKRWTSDNKSQIPSNSAYNQKVKSFSNMKFKRPDQSSDGLEDVEIVDLARDMPQPSYEDLASRDDGKLYILHKNVQADKNVQLPKRKPQFSYASGKVSSLPFLNGLHKSSNAFEDNLDDEIDDGDDLPSPSALLANRESCDPFELATLHRQNQIVSTAEGDSLESLEVAMIGIDDSMVLRRRASTPIIDSSFANGIFYFDGYSKKHAKDGYSSPLMRESRKRFRSRTPTPVPESSPVKYRRVKETDLCEEEAETHDDIQHHDAQEPVLPSWVKDMDPDIVEELKDFVDFVD